MLEEEGLFRAELSKLLWRKSSVHDELCTETYVVSDDLPGRPD